MLNNASSTLTDLGFRCTLHAMGALRRCLSAVLFHHVLEQPDPLLRDEPDIRRFSEQIAWLSRTFSILPAGEAAGLLYAGKLPPCTLCITFDDGYRDNFLHALPVLRRFGVRATFFITTRHLEGGLMWNDRVIAAVRAWPDDTMDLRRYGLDRLHLGNGRMGAVNTLLPAIKYMPQSDRERIADLLYQESGAQAERLMLNAEEIQQLHAAGMEIGGHTESHPILTALPDAAAEIEIANNKATLEGIIGQEVVSFAYPNGRPQRDYDPRHVGMLKKLGYRYAFTTAPGTATAATDPLQMPRFTPWDRSRKRYLSRLLMNYFRNPEHVPDKVEMA